MPHAPGLSSRIAEGKKKEVLVTDSSVAIKCKSITLVLLNFDGLNFCWSDFFKDDPDVVKTSSSVKVITELFYNSKLGQWTVEQVSDTVLTYIEFTYILVDPRMIWGVLRTKNLKHREFN